MSISTEHLELDMPESINLFIRFGKDFDRFDIPGPICRVTGGHGGESLLIAGPEKTVLLDCGMAYAGPVTAENLRKVLDDLGRSLDIILLSHSHYDHIGALPYIKRIFPKATVMASSHCAHVLERSGARELIRELGETARDQYDPGSDLEIITDGLTVDRVLTDGEELNIGSLKDEEMVIECIETPGHTNCSMSFMVRPLDLLILSESTGILEGENYVHTPCLKSFIQGLESLDKCESTGAVSLCLPHFGMIPEEVTPLYWDMFRDECRSKTLFVSDMIEEGLPYDKMFERYVDRYWTPLKQMEQPREAFELNSGYILKTLIAEQDQLRSRLGIN